VAERPVVLPPVLSVEHAMVTSPNRDSPRAELAYRVCPNSSAGNWYWEVSCGGAIIGRDLGLTRLRSRADALTTIVRPGPVRR
jgi:hypothetical protein